MTKPDALFGPGRCSAPFAPLAIAFAAGIVADRLGFGASTAAWGAVALACGLLAARRGGLLAAVVACVAIGGARHHAHWYDLDPHDLARLDLHEPRPAWLRGVIVEGPEVRRTDAGFDDEPATFLVLDASAISDGARWHPASGRIQVFVHDDRSDLACGAPVFAAGTLGAIPGPRNPGEADRRPRARAEGVRLRLGADSQGVWPDPEGSPDRWAGFLGEARRRSRALLVAGLPSDVQALAAALVLGRREAVDPDLNDAFARTGTTHLLAISGLHLQALALALLNGFLLLGVRLKPANVLVALATVGYVVLVGAAPSAVRSMIMTLALCLAVLCDRCATPSNRIALAALATLAWNPSYLFDAGCQLSFLAIMALFWGMPEPGPDPVPDDQPTPKTRLDALERRLEPRWKAVRRDAWRSALRCVLASAVVWIVAMPLVAFWFHTVSPIGVILNLPLIPMTTGALFCAGLSLLLSWFWAPLAIVPAWACGWLLRGTMFAVNRGAAQSWGWWFTPGPSIVGVAVFYGLLAVAAFARRARWRLRRIAYAALAIQAAGMLLAGPRPPEAAEADVLAVDHGLAVVIQGADGRVVLYDCGKMRDPRVGRRIVAPALWSRGITRVDSVILSHADSDHFNGLPDVLDRFAVGEVLIPPGFGGARNPAAERLLTLVRSRGVPVRAIVRGDRIAMSGGEIAVLHPPRGWFLEAPDNARSVVASVAVERDRVLLLTGDLEGAGLTEWASGAAPPMRWMLAPHHGGREANPGWLYDWAAPSEVLASQRRPKDPGRDRLAALEARGIAVRRTWSEGAVRLRLDAGGAGRGREPSAAMIPFGPRPALAVLGAAAGLIGCLVLAVMEWGAWTLVMPGRRLVHAEIEPEPWGPIEAIAADGVRLHGAILGAEASRGTVVFLHGFGEDRAAMRGRAESLAHRGWSVAVLDTRGRGRSEGDRTAFGGREAADLHAWLDVLAGRAPGPVLAWGRSMGAAIAARAAVEDDRIAGVVLEAPYADLRSAVGAWIARLRLPRWLAGPILWRARHLAGVSLHEPRPIEVAPRVRVPALILHGGADPVVPPEEARRLASAFSGRVEVVEVEGARHNDVFDRGGASLAERVAAWADAVWPGA